MKNFWVLICDDFCFTIIAVCVHLEWVHFSDFFSWNKNISRNSPFQLAFGFSQERFLFSYSLIMRGSRQYLYFPSSETYALDPTPYQIPLKDPLTNCVLALYESFPVMLRWEHVIIQENTCPLKNWQENEAMTDTPCLACCRQQEQRRAQASLLMAVRVFRLDWADCDTFWYT